MSSISKRFARNNGGFALIITVVLVAFLVLILVGLATFTRVETQIADNSADVAKARQNALNGLNIAVGQLQRYAGIDKAVTARGDLFGHTGAQRNIVVVWNDSGSGWGERAWLVSGDEQQKAWADVSSFVEAPTASEDADHVFVVGSRSVEDDQDRILLKKVPIRTEASNIAGLTGATMTTIGHYAYWVGDEGAKASLNLTDPTRLPTPRPAYDGGPQSDWTVVANRNRLSQQFLSQPQLANLHSAFTSIDVTDDTTAEQITKIESLAALSYLDGFPSTNQAQRIRELFHDVTIRSEAVLADLTSGDGRLKIDLSDASKRSGAIASYVGAMPVESDDYTTKHEVSPVVFPVITEAGIRFSVYRSGDDLRLAYQLDVETWNPYASALSYDNNGSGANVMTIEVAGLPTVTVRTNGTTPTTATINLNTDVDAAAFIDANVSSGGGDMVWEPGQFKVLSLAGGDLLVETNSPSPRVSGWVQPLADPLTDPGDISVEYGEIDTIEVRLRIDGQLVATYKPTRVYSGGATGMAAHTSPNDFSFGYGVQLLNNLEKFALEQDPRQSSLPADCFETSGSTWDADAAANGATTFASSDVFNYEAGSAKKKIALFDLPRQEVLSVGQLRHVISTGRPYTAANSWYDRFFFSGRPEDVSWKIEDIHTKPLPNRYVRLINPLQEPPATESDLRDGDISARYLLQTGAFNINSTSEAAWRAVLGSKLAGWIHDSNGEFGGAPALPVDLEHVFFRFNQGAQALEHPPVETGDTDDDEMIVFTGGRRLTRPQVDALSTEIVKKIKEWVNTQGHPFRSIQEFINSNVIQAAIDDTDINDDIPADFGGVPGALVQSDVIASIAPFITPRSDTFKIRAYGDVQNPMTGEVTSRVWCEAIVQRVPDLVGDLTLDAGDVADPDFGTTTHRFGRKFVIVSFRWLNTNDI